MSAEDRVILTIAEQRTPGAFERRLAEAEALGVTLQIEHAPSHSEMQLRAFAAGETTTGTVARDSREFLEKLSDIAAGRLRVV